jgi:hypothetical protein
MDNMDNDFIRYLFSEFVSSSREVEDTRQTVVSLSGALFPAIAGKLFEVEEREHIFSVWHEAVKEKIKDEAKSLTDQYMNMDKDSREDTSKMYESAGKQVPDGEMIMIAGKRKLAREVAKVRALLALEPLQEF